MLKLPVGKGDRFQAYLAQHGVKIPKPAATLRLDNSAPATAAAIKDCSG